MRGNLSAKDGYSSSADRARTRYSSKSGVERFAFNIDLAPTLAELAGVSCCAAERALPTGAEP